MTDAHELLFAKFVNLGIGRKFYISTFIGICIVIHYIWYVS